MKAIAFDTETYLITACDKAPKPVCCTWNEGGDSFISRPDDALTWSIWNDPERVFFGVNIPYDIMVMMRWHPQYIPCMVRALDEGRVIDLPLRNGLLHLATQGGAGYPMYISLADLAKKYLGLDLSANKIGDDIWRLKFGTLDGVPFNQWPVEAITYALDDAKHTYNIGMHLGDPFKLYPTEEAQNQSAVALAATSTWGFKVNQEIRGKLKDALTKQIYELTEKTKHLQWTGEGSQVRLGAAVSAAWKTKILRLVAQYAQFTGVYVDVQKLGECLNVLGLKGLIEGWFAANNVPVQSLPMQFPSGVSPVLWFQELYQHLPDIPTTTKGVSTAEECLELIKDELPDARPYIDLKHKVKMMSTYIDAYQRETAHPRFVPMVSTGRTGCRGDNSKGKNDGSSGNMQNIPRKDKDHPEEAFRTMFMARPGKVLGTVDYSQLELCTLAATIRVFYPSIRCMLGEAIDNGIDAHCVLGAKLLNTTYEHVLANKKKEGSPEANARQASKPGNFGLPAGMGDAAFVSYAKNQYGVDVSMQQASEIKRAWKAAWPEMNVYLADGSNTIKSSGGGRATMYTINNFTKANCFFTELLNGRFQSLAAEGAKRAMWAVWREMVLGWYWTRFHGSGYGSEFRDGPLKDSRLVNFVHDEIVAEHPEGDAGKTAMKQQEKLMVDVMTKTCQNKITIRVEGALSHQWEH